MISGVVVKSSVAETTLIAVSCGVPKRVYGPMPAAPILVCRFQLE